MLRDAGPGRNALSFAVIYGSPCCFVGIAGGGGWGAVEGGRDNERVIIIRVIKGPDSGPGDI